MNKTLILRQTISLLLPLCLFAAAGQAQPPASAPSLPVWEQLTVQQREQLTATIRDRWDNSSPEERARMLARAERWQQMAPQRRERASRSVNRLQDLTPEQRRELRALYHHLFTLPEPERDALRSQWQAMTPDERHAWAEAHPPPPRQSHPSSRGLKPRPSPHHGGSSPASGSVPADQP